MTHDSSKPREGPILLSRADYLESPTMTRQPHTAAESCAENIALNYLLHEVPESPQQNLIGRVRGPANGYLLPFSKERDLVEILSFLAKTRDGPGHIPAVCIQQDPNGAALKTLLAVNKRTHTDGDGLLQSLKAGFEDIFNVLRRPLYGLLISPIRGSC